jgi:hypothetical protein
VTETGGDDRLLLYAFLVPEILLMGTLGATMAASLLGWMDAFSGFSTSVRAAFLAFAVVETLIPLAVVLDMRRRDDDPDHAWIHAAALPVVNVFGVLAYLEDRRRTGD